MLMGGVVVEHHVDRFVGRHLTFDGIEKADELLMPVALHTAPDDLAFEDVEGGKQGGGAVALVIVGHRGAAPLLHWQPGLGAVERLDLAFLVDAKDHGMGRWIDIKANDILELVGESGVVGDLERAHPMRLKPLSRPDAPHRGRTDPHRLGHCWRAPVGRLVGRRLVGQRDNPIDGLGWQRPNARGPGLVAGQPLDSFVHEALLPAPDHGFALADSAGDGSGACAVSGQNNDPRAPDVLLRAVAIANDRVQPNPILRSDGDGNSLAHHRQSHKTKPSETPVRTLLSGAIH